VKEIRIEIIGDDTDEINSNFKLAMQDHHGILSIDLAERNLVYDHYLLSEINSAPGECRAVFKEMIEIISDTEVIPDCDSCHHKDKCVTHRQVQKGVITWSAPATCDEYIKEGDETPCYTCVHEDTCEIPKVMNCGFVTWVPDSVCTEYRQDKRMIRR